MLREKKYLILGYIAIVMLLFLSVPLISNIYILDWKRDFALLLGASYLFSPFGWFFDAVSLLPISVRITSRGIIAFLLLLTINILNLLLLKYSIEYQHELWGYGVALFILSIIDRVI